MGLCVCCDYRKLNNVTCKDADPLPRVEELLDALGQAQLLSSLDLTAGTSRWLWLNKTKRKLL